MTAPWNEYSVRALLDVLGRIADAQETQARIAQEVLDHMPRARRMGLTAAERVRRLREAKPATPETCGRANSWTVCLNHTYGWSRHGRRYRLDHEQAARLHARALARRFGIVNVRIVGPDLAVHLPDAEEPAP